MENQNVALKKNPIEAGMASLSSWKKKKSAIRLDVWGLTVPKIWFFGGTF